MATHRPAPTAVPGMFAESLLAQREVGARAQVIAQEAAATVAGAAVVVYVYQAEAGEWSAKAVVGDIGVQRVYDTGTLGLLAQRRETVLFAGANLAREQYAHLDVRRTVAAIAYVPIRRDEALLGAIEVVSFERALEAGDISALEELNDVAALALATAMAYESERNSNLDSITRLTQLYDVEKVFHATLQMDKLLPIIPSKVRELLLVQAANLWLVAEDEAVLLMSRDGRDATLAIGAEADEIVAWVAEQGKPLLIGDAADERLARRNSAVAEGAIRSLMVVPVVEGGALVGALECVNKNDGTPFDDDDVFFLSMMAETAAQALHNASLLEAERKIEVLETLVEVSNEITSTLNLERVLQVVVNGPQRILSYQRAAIALEAKGKLQVKAISGKTEVAANEPAVQQLRELLEFCAIDEGPTYVTVREGEVEAERDETRAKFRDYFGKSKVRTWYSVPLADDQGRLGILSFESTSPDFLGEAQFEFIKVIASQATVAIRNASLYEEVPLIGVLQPLAQRKQQFMRMEKRRRTAATALAAAAVLFLLFCPVPMRVAGDATIAAQNTAQIQTEIDGVVHNVYVHEGDRVARGTILADLNDWDYRAAVAAAEAKRATAVAAMNRALAASDGTEAGIERVQADYWAAEVTRAKERLERTRLRSPIEGIVATPHIENLVGRKLQAGDNVAQVINAQRADVDVAVDESDLPLLEAGDAAAVKLDGFPTRKFHGKVEVLSPTGSAEGDKRVFFARVQIPNEDGSIRPGMTGLAKISTGWRPAGYVLFRGLGMWAWNKIWSWVGW